VTIKSPFILFPGNEVPIRWSLVAGATGHPCTDATGTVTVFDGAGVAVPGADHLALLPTDIPGTYEAMIVGAVFVPEPGSNYRTEIKMTSPSSGGPGLWTIPTIIRARTTP
jgi:hypothetical protein